MPSVVLITVDTLRADHCSSYGYSRSTTPEIDAIASDGFVFERAYTPMPTTGPAHASLFTSRYPLAHGVVQNGLVLHDDQVTLSEILQKLGYRTAAVVSSFVLDHRFGYDQGFSFYDDDFTGPDSSYAAMKAWEGHAVENGFDRRANEATDKAIAWLDDHARDGRFFLWVHYFDPHHPYDPPESARVAWGIDRHAAPVDRALAAYDAEIAFTDGEIGRLVDRLDTMVPPEETLLVLTADHGEGFLHDFAGHGPILYEETVHVPLIFRWKETIPAGGRSDELISLVDVVPTLAGLLGIESDEPAIAGRDRSREMFDRAVAFETDPIFLQRRHYESDWAATYDIDGIPLGGPRFVDGPMFGVRSGTWKYIEAHEEGLFELYDVQADAGETINLAEERPEVVRRLGKLIASWRNGAGNPATRTAPDDVRRKLRSLGYVP